MPLNNRQVEQLFKEINSTRVVTRENSGKLISYLEAWGVIAHLNRIFGFEGWDKLVTSCEAIYDDYVTWKTGSGDKSGWDVAYRATVRLVIRDPQGKVVKQSEDVATGQARHQPSRGDAHDQAIKSAVSDALKRAAKDLGNQFGLSLYDEGSLKSVVGKSLAYEEPPVLPPPDPEVTERVSELRQQVFTDTP
jgi:recombination DNA repair RAD52 pathway protein